MPEPIDSLQIGISANANSASKQIDKLVTSLNSLKNSVSGISGLSQISSDLKEIGSIKVTGLSGLAKQINQLGNMDTSKIGQMKTALREFGSSVNQLNGISVSPQISQMSELARSISRLGNASAGTAITNMPKLADGLKQMMGELSKAPKVSQNLIDTTKALADFARTGSSGVKAANSLGTSIKNMTAKTLSAPKALKSLNTSLKSTVSQIKQVKNGILSALGVVGGIAAIISGIKKSIDVRSDVVEAQNVIDVTFGRYKDMVEDMAKTSIKDFGISELAVKNTAGRYQAMGVAAGIARKEMAKMSVTLTGLSADMASFYNQNQEDVARSMQAVFTGESEPLRKYGIDLTQATLQEWLHKKGIDAKVQSMSQAEKIMLRYNYVLENSAAAQGDFARTSGTWANQIKILKEQLMQLASVLGTAFINTLKPLVTALNKALASIIEFAVKVVNALGKIFGWKAVVSNAGIADDFSDAATGADSLADSTGKAAKNAKKLKDHLLSIDELNVVQPDTDSSGSGGSGSGSGVSGGGGITNDKAFEIVETENPFESSIKDLEGLGSSIRDALGNAMDSIEWDEVYEKAKGFGKGLAEFLNGLFSEDEKGNTVFGKLGKTIASALNSLIYAVFSFSKEFNWKDFGKALKNGIQGFINTVDLATAGYTVGNLVKGIATAVYEAVKDKKTWKKLGKKIADGINGFLKSMNEVDPETGKNGWQIAADAFSGVASAIFTALIEALKDTDWKELAEGIAEFLSGIDYGQLLVDAIKASVSLINAAKAFADGLLEGFDPKEIATSLVEGMKQLTSEDLKPIGELLSDLMPDNPIEKIFSFSDAIQEIPAVKTALEELKKIDLSKWWEESVKKYFKKETWVTFGNNIKGNITSSISAMVSDWSTSISSWWDNNVSPYFEDSKWQAFKDLIDGKISLSDAVSVWTSSISTWWADNVSSYFTDDKWQTFKDLIDGKIKISDAVESWKTSISAWWENNVSSYFTDDKWKVFKDLIDGKISMSDAVSAWKTSISGWWKDNVSPWFTKKKWDDMLTTIPTAFKSAFKAAANGAISAINAVIGGVESMVNKAVSALNTLISGINKVPGVSISMLESVTLPRIPEFRSGGFPEDGLFYANHTELVGSFSNGKTAVANNDQIIAGIEEAAYRGFSRAYSENNREASLLEELIVAVREGKEITVDGRSLVSAYDARKARNGFSFT